MGKLFLVPTPIGNLQDITLRALEVLKEVDLILAEDTRTSQKLLKHFSIEVPLRSHHMHNEHKTSDGIIREIKSGKNIALISDAGTPAISDPGFYLARACIQEGIEVDCLPGATAFVPALANSGIPCDRFTFEGFLPVKKGRQTRLQSLEDEARTMVFYESPHKLLKTLEQLAEHLGFDRQASISREISKLHEETVRGSLQELKTHFTEKAPRGEFVIVVAGKK